ncbi:hypothetical protein [Thalassoroseus pseudoceratinae]|uniref:hypothetical protein n=1 Tax=Thalassoroseus pseudoceratinae TaxID=2713176 RepID=UPI00142409BA|nr:hypothetical protein [Thalassoroseus pseudoceratinae]
MAKREYPWPKKGDKLFVEEPDADERVFHVGAYMWSGLQHASAFKTAADMVIDGAQQASRIDYRDDLIHPVAYLYRHALELKLKEIVRYGIQMHCYKKTDVEAILGNHNLAKLWTKAKQAIVHRWPSGNTSDIKATEAIVNEMHQADKDGQRWRYATDKNGRPNKHDGLPQFMSIKSMRIVVPASCIDDVFGKHSVVL